MTKVNTTDGNFKLTMPRKSLEFTGERMTTAIEGEIEFEHFHRYCLARDLCQGLDVLDVASGEGYGSAMLANVARSVTGVEIDSGSVAHAQEAYRADNLRFLHGNALDLPLDDASMDAVVSFETLEHIREHARFAAEVRRVLRAGGLFIVSSPDRAVYSARGEHFNRFHLLELNEPEFESFLRANFAHAAILRQRAILGSVIAASEDVGDWRSYERRAPEYIEASSGLARAPYLIGLSSDAELPPIASSLYIDRRSAQEAVAQATELEDAIGRMQRQNFELREKDQAIAEHQARIEELNRVLEGQRSEIAQTHDLRAQLAVARSRPGKVLRDLMRHRILKYLSTKSPPLSAQSAARLAVSARKRDPKRSLATAPAPAGRERALPAKRRAAAILDARKKTILVVSHEATRTGAPILALNIVQRLAARYNVVSLILGGGELADDFGRSSALLVEVDRLRMPDLELEGVIRDVAAEHPLTFAIVNSVESRMALKPLQAAGVPTVSLVHEFSSYTRPRSAFPDVLALSTETVFSTKMTLENAVTDLWLYPGASVHVAPQGKCVVPATPGATSEASVEKIWLARNLRPEAGSREFLVIGLGDIQLRKGVDLFIECATIIKNQPGGERFQFVWIGKGYDPEREITYSVYLADQMKRAGLGLQMKILRSTSQIEFAYQSADLLLLSSRLDPLPNVAIDALTLGLPVLCFDKTTGIADFLNENGLGESCVAQYLDTHDMARKVMALADSDSLRTSVSERSRAAAQSAFDMDAYVSRIEAIAEQAVGAEARVKDEIKTILASGKFRGDFFKPPGMESSSDETLVEDYVRRMASGFSVRKPTPGFQPTVYSALRSREERTGGDPFADFLRKGSPEGPWLQRVIQNGGASMSAPGAGLRAALHLHVYYEDKLAGIVERLKLNASAPDLFISVTAEDAAARTREALKTYRGQIVDVRATPNFGRDIGPLLTQFGPSLCSSYDVIGHLHTKKSVLLENPSFAEAWNTFLLENLVGGRRGGAMVDAILTSMASDPAIGIVFPDDPHVLSWTGNRTRAEALAARMNCGELPEQFNFPVGSMFWMRAAVFKQFVALGLTWDDYDPEPLPIDGAMVHAIERLFGVVPATMGMTCAVTNVRGLTR